MMDEKLMKNMTVAELQEAAAKVAKYEEGRKYYVEVALKLSDMATELKNIAEKLDPYLVMQQGRGRGKATGISFKDKAEELLEKMRDGMQITAKLIQNLYPEMNEKQIAYLMKMMREKNPQIQTARDGIAIRLYLL